MAAAIGMTTGFLGLIRSPFPPDSRSVVNEDVESVAAHED